MLVAVIHLGGDIEMDLEGGKGERGAEKLRMRWICRDSTINLCVSHQKRQNLQLSLTEWWLFIFSSLFSENHLFLEKQQVLFCSLYSVFITARD